MTPLRQSHSPSFAVRPLAPGHSSTPAPHRRHLPLWWLSACLALGAMGAQAQTAQGPGPVAPVHAHTLSQQAADPATAVPAWPVQSLPPVGPEVDLPSTPEQALAIWRKANTRVAEFPRGHADILKQEVEAVRHAPAAGTATASAAPGTIDFPQALRQSLWLRPDLFTHAGMNTLERAAVQVAYANHVRDVRQAWVEAIAAAESLALMAEVLETAQTGAELGQRMVRAGNWSQAKLLREQLVQAEAWQAWVEARQTQVRTREHLARLLGEWHSGTLATLPGLDAAGLPPLPTPLQPGPGLDASQAEAAVLRSHPHLAWLREQAQRQHNALGHRTQQAWTQAWTRAVEAATTDTAPDISDLTLLRDHTLDKAVRADAELLALATRRRSMARETWAHLQARHVRALHAQDTVNALQSALTQETQLRYNGMLQNTWELLASARDRLHALNAAVQARRDFWLVHANWQALLAGSDATPSTSPASSASATRSTPQGH